MEKAFTLQALQADYQDVPLWIPLEKPYEGGALWLTDEKWNRLPAQQVQIGRQSYLVWIEPQLLKGTQRTYRVVEAATGKSSKPPLQLVRTEGAIQFLRGKELLAAYVFTGAPKPYLYPLIGPNGKPITRHFPMKQVADETMDHPHHRSCWFTHGAVNGIDFWTEGAGRGRIVHRRFEAIEGGPVLGRVRALNDWLAPDRQPVLEEEQEFRFYSTQQGRLLEFETTLRATEGDVVLGDTKEGTFALRVACSMEVTRKSGGQIVNARGQRDAEAWGKKAEWCDYSGPVEGEIVGIAVFDHPQNLRHPTTWHVREYGLFAVNPFGLHDFLPGTPKGAGDYTIRKGESLTFRYRIWLHRGRAEEARVATQYESYRWTPLIKAK